MDVTAVGFQLGFAGALGADRPLTAGARLTLQMRPHTDQTRQQVLILGQLHLQTALFRLGPLGKNIEDQAAAVDDLHAGHLRQHTDLGGAQVIIEDHHGGMFLLHHAPDFLHLPLADKAVGIGFLTALQDHAHHRAAGRVHQRRQLLHALLIGIVLAQNAAAQAHQHRVISFLFFRHFQFHKILRSNHDFPLL